MNDAPSPRVTWLLPVRNGMPFLPATLASIEAQTYRHWEVIAWDNGSTDRTVEELQRWIPARLPGRVVSDRPRDSLGESRRELVCASTTEFCANLDADDLALPTRLAEQVCFLDEHPEISLVGSQAESIDERGIPCPGWGRLPGDHHQLINLLLANSPLVQSSVLFRRDAVLEAGNYADVGSINVEDYDLWLRLARRHRLANLDQVLVQYRIHPRSTTVRALAEGKLKQAADEAFYRHAGTLFGCTRAQARALRECEAKPAIVVLWRICQYLEHTQGISAAARLRSRTFLDAAQQLTARSDLLTRLVLASLEPAGKAKLRGLGAVGEVLLRQLGLERAAGALRKLGRTGAA